MADDVRLDGLTIPIGYDYDASGLKKATKDVEAATDEVSKKQKEAASVIEKIFQATENGSKKVESLRKRAINLQSKSNKLSEQELKLQERLAFAKEKQAQKSVLLEQKEAQLKKSKKKIKVNKETGVPEVYSGRTLDPTATKSYWSVLNQAKSAANSVANAERQLNAVQTERIKITNELNAAVKNTAQAYLAEEAEKKAEEQRKIAEEVKNTRLEYDRLVGKLHEQQEAQKALARQKMHETFDKASASVKKLTQRLKQINLQKIVAQLYLLKRAWSQLIGFVEAASSWVENINLLESVFGDATEAAKDFVNLASENFGLNPNALAQIASTFMQIATSMGQATEVGYQMSEAMSYLALDLASLRNMEVKDVAANLTSALVGQARAVNKFGIDVTQDAINEYVEALGIASSSLTQADKQLVRFILMIKQSETAWGDMAKTINTFANQQRIMNDQFTKVRQNLGAILIGTFQLGDSFEKASETAGIATKALWYVNGALIALNTILDAIVPKTEDLNGGMGQMAEDVNKDLDGVESAAKGALASFDKFNVLGTGGGVLDEAATSAKIQAAALEEGKKYTERISKMMENINMYSKEIANTFIGAIFPNFKEWQKENPDGLFKDWAAASGELKGKLDSLKDSLGGLISGVLMLKTPLLGIAAVYSKSFLKNPEEGIKNLTEVGTKISQMLERIAPRITNLLDKIVPLVLKFAEAAINVLDWVSSNIGLEETVWMLVAAFGAFKIFEIVSNTMKAVKTFKELTEATKTLTTTTNSFGKALQYVGIGFGAFSLVYGLLDALGELNQIVKIVVSSVVALAAGLFAAAIAKKALFGGWESLAFAASLGAAIAGVAGIVTGAVDINKHADGGFQTGGLFYAGEKGPEWVGRQGNTSTIMNDTQMSDIMRDSVAQGVKIGMISAGAGQNAQTGVGDVYLDGNKVGQYVAGSSGFRNEANRRMAGLKWR